MNRTIPPSGWWKSLGQLKRYRSWVRRPRAEWYIQPGTHEALITADIAEKVLSRLEQKKTMRTRGDAHLLSGILVDPTGRRWHGDSGYYRCGRRRLKADHLEQQVIDQIGRDSSSDAIVAQATRLARKAAQPRTRDGELKTLQRQGAELERKIGRVRLVMTEMKNPAAMAPQLEDLVEKKKHLDEQTAALAGELDTHRVMRMITEDDTRAFLGSLAEHLKSLDRTHIKDRLRALVAKIELHPADLTTRIFYAIPAATGVSVASPQRTTPSPIVRITGRWARLPGALRVPRAPPPSQLRLPQSLLGSRRQSPRLQPKTGPLVAGL